jgi:predicted phosphoribosyltransferase
MIKLTRTKLIQELENLISSLEIKKEKVVLVATSLDVVELLLKLAKKFETSFEILFVTRIYALHNQECEIGAISENETLVVNEALIDSFEIGTDYLHGEATRRSEELLKNRYTLRQGNPLCSFEDKNVLLVDEASQTGLTLSCAIDSVKKSNPKTISLAVGLLPSEVKSNLQDEVDEIHYAHLIEHFVDSGHYYENGYKAVSVEEVKQIESENLKVNDE